MLWAAATAQSEPRQKQHRKGWVLYLSATQCTSYLRMILQHLCSAAMRLSNRQGWTAAATTQTYGVLGQQVALQREMECITARLGSQWRLWRCLRSMQRRGWLSRQITSIVTTERASNSCRCGKLQLCHNRSVQLGARFYSLLTNRHSSVQEDHGSLQLVPL